jgi:anhydro-N-acetylmuramic acid kinase
MVEFSYRVLGLMSGTSLDGVDIAICSFYEKKDIWNFQIQFVKTYPYDKNWKEKLKNAYKANGRELMELDRAYGDFLSEIIKNAISESGIMPDMVASHGQTIYHSPEKRMTCQIGHGANIAIGSNLPVISDFRSTDVALGGQGAPLVPFGDRMLFHEFHSCLNLGGFSNISFEVNQQRCAFDICPVNIIINDLVGRMGYEYDEDGINGSKGTLNEKLLSDLDELMYYKQEFPKSLGYEWVESQFLPVINNCDIYLNDKLTTVYYHIANQIGSVFNTYKLQNCLVTGGGAHNNYLIKLLESKTQTKIIIPDKNLVDFKEAIIFAFLGLQRFMNRINTFASVTGAVRDSIGGSIYMP